MASACSPARVLAHRRRRVRHHPRQACRVFSHNLAVTMSRRPLASLGRRTLRGPGDLRFSSSMTGMDMPPPTLIQAQGILPLIPSRRRRQGAGRDTMLPPPSHPSSTRSTRYSHSLVSTPPCSRRYGRRLCIGLHVSLLLFSLVI